jgi:hypothetical protein
MTQQQQLQQQHCCQLELFSELCMCSTSVRFLFCNWLLPPLLLLLLLAGVFTTNKRGYPILSKAHQELLSTAYRHNVQVGGHMFNTVCNCSVTATLNAVRTVAEDQYRLCICSRSSSDITFVFSNTCSSRSQAACCACYVCVS